MKILLAPHNDDETLFAAFTLCAHLPHVIVVLKSQVQEDRGTGITAAQRESETDCAMNMVGCDWEQWPFPDNDPDWSAIETELVEVREHLKPERVFAPVMEVGAHEHHNMVGMLAVSVFGVEAVTGYYTYTSHGGRSRGGVPVVPEPAWVGAKLCALTCYESQIREPSTRPHFVEALTEYLDQ